MKKLILISVLVLSIGMVNAKDIKRVDTVSYANTEKEISIENWMLQPNWLDVSEQEINIEDVRDLQIENFEDTPILLQNWMFQSLDRDLNRAAMEEATEIEPWMMQSIKLDNESDLPLETWMFN